MASFLTLYNGAVYDSNSCSVFGTLFLQRGFSSTLVKDQVLVLDRTQTVPSNLANAAYGESYTFDTLGTEYGHQVVGTASLTPASQVRTRASIYGLCTTGENTSGGNTSTGIGVQGIASAGAGATTAIGFGVSGAAVLAAGLVGQFAGLSGQLNDASASAQASVGTTTSRYACLLTNLGTTKGAAFCFAVKSGTVPTNMTHGYVCDSASVDTTAFSVISGASTVVWGIGPDGKPTVAITAPAAGTGPFAAGAANQITISLNNPGNAAGASVSVTVNTTAVTASSRIFAGCFYAGQNNSFPVICISTITPGTSFQFRLGNGGSAAIDAAVTIWFKIEN